MKARLSRRLQDIWYKDPFIGTWLMPLGFIFSDITKFRKFLYRIGLKKSYKLPVPVIIVGNITVGGTGKTPLVIFLAKFLQESGYKPGIISRGYGRTGQAAQQVLPDSSPADVGDEPLLLARHAGCPVVVGADRVAAAQLLLSQHDCNVLLSDDGLQHYALQRDIEIVVVDSERRFGNGYCLPAGPLRESVERLQTVDFVVVNGQAQEPNEFSMSFDGDLAVNLLNKTQQPLTDFASTPGHAVAAIGNPERFFKLLKTHGLNCTEHAFPDHYQFEPADLAFGDAYPVFMTEKDAVKCTAFAQANHWYVPITASPEPKFLEQLLTLLRDK